VSRLATSFVLGYHGCDKATGMEALKGKISLVQSDKPYDWLGPGAYFWESDPQRALEWAKAKGYADPFVIGAVIDFRNCLDLVSREDLEILKAAYYSYEKMQKIAKVKLAKNKSVKGQHNADNILRYLDCAVIKHLFTMIDNGEFNGSIEPFDTVRGMFPEGDEVFPGSGFKNRTHVQIAVKNSECIRGIFIPCPYPA
jgi:hypothetical protein